MVATLSMGCGDASPEPEQSESAEERASASLRANCQTNNECRVVLQEPEVDCDAEVAFELLKKTNNVDPDLCYNAIAALFDCYTNIFICDEMPGAEECSLESDEHFTDCPDDVTVEVKR